MKLKPFLTHTNTYKQTNNFFDIFITKEKSLVIKNSFLFSSSSDKEDTEKSSNEDDTTTTTTEDNNIMIAKRYGSNLYLKDVINDQENVNI